MSRFNATILDTHPAFATGLFNTLNAGQSPSPDQVIELGNLTGALNYWKANPDKFVPVPTPGPPGSGPDPSDPGALIRAAPSQWAKNLDRTDAEYAWAVAQGYWTEADRHVITNWWHDNGVKGRYDAATKRYLFYTYPNGQETENVDTGQADAASEAASGKTIPGPALP